LLARCCCCCRQVWDSAIVAAKYAEKWPQLFAGKRCCDLSAGCGLVGEQQQYQSHLQAFSRCCRYGRCRTCAHGLRSQFYQQSAVLSQQYLAMPGCLLADLSAHGTCICLCSQVADLFGVTPFVMLCSCCDGQAWGNGGCNRLGSKPAPADRQLQR
jgi:hypothetical protein